MFLKQITSIALLCMISTAIFAQDAFDTLQRPLNRKVGVYKTYKDFLKNNPCISKPIKVIRVDPDKKSINPKYTCEFQDSTSIDERVWGLFDGNKIYYRSGSSEFIPMHFAGKFSFHIYRDYANMKMPAPVYTADKKKTKVVKGTKVFDYAIKFYNDNGKLKKATSQAIGWLLRNDKDFTEEYNKEEVYNYGIFLKYLLKMNQRYPLE